MGTPEILLLTGSAVAACALFVLGVLAGMMVANRAADRAYEQQQAELEQAERDRRARLLAQQHEQERAQMGVSARVRPRPVSLTDNDPTRPILWRTNAPYEPIRIGDDKEPGRHRGEL